MTDRHGQQYLLTSGRLLEVKGYRRSPYRSPISYPGGKSLALRHIVPYLDPDMTSLCSPFFGAGHIELYLAMHGVRVYGYDIIRPLVEFWRAAISDPGDLADRAIKHETTTLDGYHNKIQEMDTEDDPAELGAMYYALNRVGYGGFVWGGGLSIRSKIPKFGQSINRIRAYIHGPLSVDIADFSESIPRHPSSFLYLDPPYFIPGAKGYYGRRNTDMSKFAHGDLRDILASRGRWALSYNDCPEIAALYKGYKILRPCWVYSMGNRARESRELLILSHDYPEWCHEPLRGDWEEI